MRQAIRWANMVRGMVTKNLLVTFRYPVNLLGRVLSVFVVVPMYVLAIATFWNQGMAGMVGDESGRQVTAAIVYGYVLYQFASDALWLVGYHIRQEQLDGTLESLCVTQASPVLYVVSRLVEPLVLSLVAGAAAVGIGIYTFGAPSGAGLLTAGYALVCAFIGIAGLALVLAALALTLLESIQVVTAACQFGLMTLCGMVAPFAALPEPVRAVSKLIPLSYCVDLFRTSLMQAPRAYPELAGTGVAIWMSAVWAIVMPLIGYAALKGMHRRAKRLGLYGRY